MSATVLSEMREYAQILEANDDVEHHATAKLGGAIAAGIVIGAVLAFLVGGAIGASETTSGSISISHSVSAP